MRYIFCIRELLENILVAFERYSQTMMMPLIRKLVSKLAVAQELGKYSYIIHLRFVC